jgi:twitching motility two-component system response regulator PilG
MNGVAALDDIFTDCPDLIMLDIMLPGLDGFEICRRIKKNPATSQIPVIFVSAKNAPEDIIRGKLVGGDEYITKPFKSSKVLSAVKMLLDNDVSPPQKQECLH